jgi:hypothetical protein
MGAYWRTPCAYLRLFQKPVLARMGAYWRECPPQWLKTVTDGDPRQARTPGLPGTGRLEILDQACESFGKDPASWPSLVTP